VTARRSSAIGVGRTRLPLGPAYAALLIMLYLPIGVLFVFSFNAGTTLSFPIEL
jgi:ABC-type spermidine/putrescine transport system permease subunit II